MNSDSLSESEELNNGFNHRTIFMCGFIPKRWHNSILTRIIHDLLPHFYVACNNESWTGEEQSKEIVSNADVMIFVVNEYTLNDSNCLKMLQYAWHLMIPIVMLRPPKTKLVISKRENKRKDISVGNGSITRIAKEPIGRRDPSILDYNLLQDVLHEGYKNSIVYNRAEHEKSMIKLHDKLEKLFNVVSEPFTLERPPFFLSPSKNSQLVVSSRSTSEREQPTNEAQSLNYLNLSETKELTKKTQENECKKKNMHTLLRQHSSCGYTSQFSRDSSLERRMSLTHLNLDDLSNYQQTQYLVFSLKDGNKKPTLIKFPEDLIEEKYKEESLWGSDTSLEEEAQNATRITTGIEIDLEDSSPISSPPPYIEPI